VLFRIDFEVYLEESPTEKFKAQPRCRGEGSLLLNEEARTLLRPDSCRKAVYENVESISRSFSGTLDHANSAIKLACWSTYLSEPRHSPMWPYHSIRRPGRIWVSISHDLYGTRNEAGVCTKPACMKPMAGAHHYEGRLLLLVPVAWQDNDS
jgi:hypothetical protein